jgi:tRNA pseudouridine55 synthase
MMSDSSHSGIINLNKPAGISSARAVAMVKRQLPRGTKIGHAGTLDPFATGVLLLLVGKATRLCETLMDQPKQYVATVKLGATTITDDPEKPETPTPGAAPIERERVEAALQSFVGEILQRPPAYSAMKIEGRRAYDVARRGGQVKLEPRPVKVYSIELLEYQWPFVKLRIDCGRGTYIRAIARDLGERLGCGGYLTELTRTRVGDYQLADAVDLAAMIHEGHEGNDEIRMTSLAKFETRMTNDESNPND